MQPTIYRRPAQGEVFRSEFEIKRSKFLGFIAQATCEGEARAFIAEIKSQFPDARHHCSAFRYHVAHANPVERSSDDGEPSGTAGLPMLDVLRGSGLLDVVAVSVRYFGGIKLGTGGLVRAYSESTQLTLEQVRSESRGLRELYRLEVGHDVAGKLEAELRRHDFAVVDAEYGAKVVLSIGVSPGQRPELDAMLAESTQGRADTKLIGSEWIDLRC
ncbi:YigZ family protein [Corynebacterium sp. H127]|uniref:YigZ family protein n=1 Tax=Corynebacterium sp. H127 TaxID=3133418 RepID=UPI0030A8B36A